MIFGHVLSFCVNGVNLLICGIFEDFCPETIEYV